MAIFWPYASDQLLQRISASTPLCLGDLDYELAVTHLHVGGLADTGPYFLRECLGNPQR
jgi:hypothetical protein